MPAWPIFRNRTWLVCCHSSSHGGGQGGGQDGGLSRASGGAASDEVDGVTWTWSTLGSDRRAAVRRPRPGDAQSGLARD